MACAPEEPPVTISTGRESVKPKRFRPSSYRPENRSVRRGVPVTTPFLPICAAASGKVQHTLTARGVDSLLARPGVMSDSCSSTGTWCSHAPYTTGTDTKPPLENTMSGLIWRMSEAAWNAPCSTRNGSVKFFRSK